MTVTNDRPPQRARLGALIEVLDRHLPPPPAPRFDLVPIWLVQQCVARVAGVPLADLLAERRTKALADARHIAMYLAWRLSRASLCEIARAFNRKDHTTVLHACRKTEALMLHDPKFDAYVGQLRESILRIRTDLQRSGYGEAEIRELVQAS